MINKTFLDGVENALQAGGMTYFITPYHLTTNPTVNSGATRDQTCTGVGGIPSGALAVWVAISITCSAAATSLNLYPTGGSATGYPQVSAPVASQFFETAILIPLSAGGQFTAKSNGGNTVMQDWYIYAYVI